MTATVSKVADHHWRIDLPPKRKFIVPLPDRMKKLAVDRRGFPVPMFVTWFMDGKPAKYGVGDPDFRVIDPKRIAQCVNDQLCWICGDKMGTYKSFVIGPMCAINRTIAEPPSHHECAEFAGRCCPFLASPSMKRNVKNLPSHQSAPGIPLDRNPGVACVWTTKRFKPYREGRGVLFRLGEPVAVEWWAEGNEATRDQVVASIASGFPTLQAIAEQEGLPALRDLGRYVERVIPLLPAC